MHEEYRPNPDALLAAIKREESRSKHGIGRLKIFLGMAAGVGKTYKMLEEAQNLKKSGVDVVVGIINTHGRKDTAALLEGLKSVPLQKINYKEIICEEFDLDAVLKLKPQLVLVDELAHTNVPGSRHPKRWQDVIELIDNGIDVYTTLNVQHIESLKEVVEGITGISIKETVPDSIIEASTHIEIVDITTEELLHRLRDGKVYLGDQSAIAARHFFQEDRLTALREVVLRYAAEKVDHDLHSMVSTVGRADSWKPRERLLVAVSHSPHSQKLIRTTRRLAFNLGAPWIAVHVEDGSILNSNDRAQLTKNLSLARDLGGEVVTTSDPNISIALERIARQKGVTQIIVGRPPKPKFFGLFQETRLLDDLARACTGIDIHIIRQDPLATARRWTIPSIPMKSKLFPYIFVFFFVLLITGLSWLVFPLFGYKIIGVIFLLSILLLSLYFRKGPIFFSAILYAISWDFFFAPPIGGLGVSTADDIAFIILFLLTAIVTGILTDRSKTHREMLIKREETTQALYEIARIIANAPSSTHILKAIQEHLGTILKGTCEILVKGPDNELIIPPNAILINNEKEKNAALWVFENEKEAGWSTSTLPLSENLYIPLKGYNEAVGVLIYHPKINQNLSIEEENFLYTVGQQLANYLERSLNEERSLQTEHLHEVEGIYQTILGSISKEFQHPLVSIQNAIKDLKNEQLKEELKGRSRNIFKIEHSSAGLAHIVDNISVMAKLSTGLIPIKKENHDVKELIDHVCGKIKATTNHHKIVLEIQENLPSVAFDYGLMELLLTNMISNAFAYSPPESSVEITAKTIDKELVLSVADEGNGIPPDKLEVIFEKFYRIPGNTKPGIGLGLTISKSIAEIHGGRIKAENRPTGGAIFTLYLPLEAHSGV